MHHRMGFEGQSSNVIERRSKGRQLAKKKNLGF